MNKQTVRDIDLAGKRVLVRVDYNVPMKDGTVADDFRIRAGLPTLQYLLDQGCSLVLLSHLGEPKGAPDPAYSLRPVAAKAEQLLGRPIRFYDDCTGSDMQAAAAALKGGEVIMGENVRFHAEELSADEGFARELAKLGEVYVNDAFAVDHRDQASVSTVAKFLPAVAGLLVEKEVDYIQGAIDTPNRPLVAIIGGAKVSTKIEILRHLIPKVDVLVLGGAMANTFFLAQNKTVGKSLVEFDQVETAKELLDLAQRENTELILPAEVVVSRSLEAPKDQHVTKPGMIKDDEYVVDATPDLAVRLGTAVEEFLDFDHKCTVIWNGPLGLTEVSDFAQGSLAMADAVVKLPGVTSIIGGGDTAAFLDQAGRHDQFTWVSTGGGASLELLAGKPLPGVTALHDK